RVAHEGVNIALPASFQHRKNQLDAVRALSKIEDPSVRLTLWGNISPLNPYFIAVQELIENLGLTDRVSIPGFGTEEDVYSTADIVLMTSLSEGFPYPLLEAMYQGRPTVSYDFDFGPREAIEHGGSGYIIPLGDVDELAERLGELAADPALREQFGARARERYDERFAPAAVAEQYRDFLGPHDAPIDLTEVFATDGVEPIAAWEIGHRVRRSGLRRVHEVTVDSSVQLYDSAVDDGETITHPQVRREDGRTVIEFPVGGASVVSYSPQAGSPDRHYLAGPADGTSLPVLPRLRRDASYGDASSAGDGLVAARGGSRHVSWHTTPGALVEFSGEAAEAIAWKVRQVLPAPKPRRAEERSASTTQPSAPEAMSPAPEPASGASSVPAAPSSPQRGLSGVGKAIGLPAQAMGSVGRVARTYAATGMKALADAVAVTPSEGTHRELPRHPWFPVTSGVDSFGTPLNATGGVEVSNDGGAGRPSVTVRGEYDWLLL